MLPLSATPDERRIIVDGQVYRLLLRLCPCCGREWWSLGPAVCFPCWTKGHRHGEKLPSSL